MTRSVLFLSAAAALLLAACGSTPEDNGGNAIERRAALEAIQDELNDALKTGYGDYLLALSSKSDELVTLAKIPENLATGSATELSIRSLGVSVSSAALLADLPYHSDEVKTAIRNGFAAGDQMKALCASKMTADCELGGVYLDTIGAREAASDTLGLSVEPEANAETAKLAYQTFEASLITAPTATPDEPSAGMDTRLALARQNACTISWAHTFFLPSLEPETVTSVNDMFAETMASAFDQTDIDLCADGTDTCEAATVCAEDATSASCQKRKTAALLSSCGPASPGLKDTLTSLSGGAG